jgi:hypothetical protein
MWRRAGGRGVVAALLLAGASLRAAPATFVFTSDIHYGINRGKFRGDANVESRIVNAALVEKINRLPAARLPQDEGLRAGEPVGPIAFVAITGDLTNRQELYPLHLQSASTSWRQFEAGFLRRLAVRDAAGQPTPLWIVPGNHDVSNAIGSPSTLVPATDATSLAEIYNRMMRPVTPRTKDTYRYATDQIDYSREVNGVHLVFLTMWPDRTARAWMATDLARVPATTPVFFFCHDPPSGVANHFTNPNGDHGINPRDKFENVLAQVYADGATPDRGTLIEQRELAAFLRTHRNVVACFHGHNNWHECYTWRGPDGDLALNVFRADSPMKGRESGKNQEKISFQVVTFDAASNTLTARECLWNAQGANDTDATPVAWGASHTVSIAPREK